MQPSTPPAGPGEAPLERLPHELHRTINRYLTGDLQAMANDLGALSRTSHALQDAWQADTSLHVKQRLLARLVPMVGSCFDDRPTWDGKALQRIDEFESLVGLLDPARRERLVVDAVADLPVHGPGFKARALRQLGMRLEHFDVGQRARLLAAALRIGPGRVEAGAIAAFASSDHVSVAQRIRLAYAVSAIGESASSVTTLIKLASTLPQEDAKALDAPIAQGIATALDFLEWILLTGEMPEFAAALGNLSEPRSDRLVDAVLALEHHEDQAEAIADMGASLAHVGESRRARVCAAATGFADEDCRVQAIAGLGAGLAHFTAMQRGELLSAALALQDESGRATALAGLARGMASLGEQDRTRLFDATSAFVTGHAKATAMDGLGPAAAHLSELQRAQVVESVLGMDSPWQAVAICSLGAGLAHFAEAQRDALVNAAIRVADAEDRAIAIAGMGGGVAHLSRAQHDKLLVAMAGIDEVVFRTRALAGLAKGVASMPVP